MNTLIARHALRPCFKRALNTGAPFVPPASLRDISEGERHSKPKPESSTFYTGRSTYYDQLNSLESAIHHSRRALKNLQLFPLPAFARASLPPLQPVWLHKEQLALELNCPLNTARYRRVTTLLNQLNDFQRIASAAGAAELQEGLSSILALFERENKQAVLARGKRKPASFDEYGRTYTKGKRKTSTARVWMIPVRSKPSPPAPAAKPEETPDLFLEPSDAPVMEKAKVDVTPTSIIVNNRPLAEYFPLPVDREKVVRPLKLAGVLGAYNVFAIVRGGGTSGQSGAVAHGIARGLEAHEPTVRPVLSRVKLLRRDPRMVERKKTGMAKARKRYTWVKR